jgi:solute carrier family 25 phosphate transporter 3
MEAIRIRQVAEPDFAPAGWVQAGLKMLKNEGFSGLWKGMPSMLYKQVPYAVTKNVLFDFLTTFSYIML